MVDCITSGGAPIGVSPNEDGEYEDTVSLYYDPSRVTGEGLKLGAAWVTAAAGDTQRGLELLLVTSTNKVVAGPVTTMSGGGQMQPVKLYPVHANVLNTDRGQVLYLKARDRSANKESISLVGQLTLQLIQG